MELVDARIIADGNHDKAFASQVMEVDKTSAVDIKVLAEEVCHFVNANS